MDGQQQPNTVWQCVPCRHIPLASRDVALRSTAGTTASSRGRGQVAASKWSIPRRLVSAPHTARHMHATRRHATRHLDDFDTRRTSSLHDVQRTFVCHSVTTATPRSARAVLPLAYQPRVQTLLAHMEAAWAAAGTRRTMASANLSRRLIPRPFQPLRSLLASTAAAQPQHR